MHIWWRIQFQYTNYWAQFVHKNTNTFNQILWFSDQTQLSKLSTGSASQQKKWSLLAEEQSVYLRYIMIAVLLISSLLYGKIFSISRLWCIWKVACKPFVAYLYLQGDHVMTINVMYQKTNSWLAPRNKIFSWSSSSVVTYMYICELPFCQITQPWKQYHSIKRMKRNIENVTMLFRCIL